jgi:alpha-L-fucosidase
MTSRNSLSGCLSLFLPLIFYGLHSVSLADDDAQIKKNAAEQAAALHQDPGGADRSGLIAALVKKEILAGKANQRTTHPEAQWFGNAALGLFLHWGIASVHGGIDLSWPMVANMGNGIKLKPTDYWKLADDFKAENYDPNLWLKAAKDAGFEYAVLTAKHHDGYTLWPSKASQMGVHVSLPGRDLIKDYVEACRANGLKVGLYYSGPDWIQKQQYMSFNYRSEHGGNSSLPPIPGRPDFDINFQPTTIPKMPAEVAERIKQNNRKQLTELLTNYGKIDLLWFDGGSGSDITLEEIHQLQPTIVINNRGEMNASNGKFHGDYFTMEHGDQPFRPPGWWEQLRIWNSPCWGYMKSNETRYTDTASILKSVARSRAWGGAVLANCGPRPDGTMPDPFYRGMKEVQEWMKVNGESIHGTQAMPESVESNVPITTRGNTWYLHAVAGNKGKLTLTPGNAVKNIKAARNLRNKAEVPFQWQQGILEISVPQGDPKTPHDVIAITLDL